MTEFVNGWPDISAYYADDGFGNLILISIAAFHHSCCLFMSDGYYVGFAKWGYDIH